MELTLSFNHAASISYRIDILIFSDDDKIIGVEYGSILARLQYLVKYIQTKVYKAEIIVNTVRFYRL